MKNLSFQADLDAALAAASDTKRLVIGYDVTPAAAALFLELFPGKKAIIVADNNTWRVSGEQVHQDFVNAGIEMDAPFIFDDPALFAEYSYVDQLDAALATTEAIPIAVGSGTINDLVKLSAHHSDRRYISIATAASMDGYTAYGASITSKGSKQTFDCPAPLAAIADLGVIAKAPDGMNAAGYADLAAKLTAGADWIIADALGIEPVDPPAWQMVQGNLRAWLANPAGVASGDATALENLVAGLMMGGFAMQHLQSSRPASGAEHQFSHLWDMQHHKHEGKSVSHGFKVGIGTLASARLYEFLTLQDFEKLDVDAALAEWPSWNGLTEEITELFSSDEIRDKAYEEQKAKYTHPDELRSQLISLRDNWPVLRQRLQDHLPATDELAAGLRDVGAPFTSEDIGISTQRLRSSYRQALHIRRRFTVLDLADRTGRFSSAMDALFNSSSVLP